MGTTEELRVMGMAMTTRVFRILPERSGLSVTPPMAPAAEISLPKPRYSRYQAKNRPTMSLVRASSTWDTAVGTMSEWPWA